MRTATLYRVLGVLLLGIAAVFTASHLNVLPQLALPTAAQGAIGVVAGFGIGVVAAVMGVAGGELLIPTITLLYAVDVKLAGGLPLPQRPVRPGPERTRARPQPAPGAASGPRRCHSTATWDTCG